MAQEFEQGGRARSRSRRRSRSGGFLPPATAAATATATATDTTAATATVTATTSTEQTLRAVHRPTIAVQNHPSLYTAVLVEVIGVLGETASKGE